MKCIGRVLKVHEKDGKKAALILLEKLPKVGERVSVKWGKIRSLSQNSFYWVFLDWLLAHGLKDEYASPEELHESLKAAFLSKPNKHGLLKIGSTTELTKDDFGQYMDKVNLAMAEYYKLDTSEFWREHEENYQLH